MAGRIAEEIKQTRPFRSPAEEALLNLLRTSDVFEQRLAEFLKPHDLSGTQYNVLRILRGAGEAGLPCGEIAGRMIAHDPDMTRLLDRLEKRRLVARLRDRRDRRVVTTRATEEALRLLESLDRPLVDLHREMLGHLGSARLRQLTQLLEQARQAPEQVRPRSSK